MLLLVWIIIYELLLRDRNGSQEVMMMMMMVVIHRNIYDPPPCQPTHPLHRFPLGNHTFNQGTLQKCFITVTWLFYIPKNISLKPLHILLNEGITMCL